MPESGWMLWSGCRSQAAGVRLLESGCCSQVELQKAIAMESVERGTRPRPSEQMGRHIDGRSHKIVDGWETI